MVISKKNLRRNLIQVYTHQNVLNRTILKKKFGGACPRTHLAKLRDMQISKSEKDNSCLPPAKFWLRP